MYHLESLEVLRRGSRPGGEATVALLDDLSEDLCCRVMVVVVVVVVVTDSIS